MYKIELIINMHSILLMDQFYTKMEIAEKCWKTLQNKVNIKDFNWFIEPSAGTGNFYKLLPIGKRRGIDIDPKYPGVIQMDYLTLDVSGLYQDGVDKYMVIGNPPFGKISSFAVRFFNKSAEYAEVIAFIVPRTFKRVSVQNRLNLNFHLIYNEDLPMKPCCFEPKMGAKCCFQIWKKKEIKRPIVEYAKTHKDFEFLKYGPKDEDGQPTPPEGADFSLKAYGSNCGKIVIEDLDALRPKSWHFIKSKIDTILLKKRFNFLDYSMSKDTVRQDSLGQKELIYLYGQKY
jgi:hypothetical protein